MKQDPAPAARAASDGPRLLRYRDVIRATGLSRTTIYDLARVGRFPAPVKLTDKATAFDARAVAEWIEAKLAGREWVAS